MVYLTYLLGIFYFYIESCYGEIVLTQTPGSISVSPGENAVIHCKSSADVGDSSTSYINWYQKKPGHPPTLLIYRAINRQSGVPARFSGSRSGSPYRDFTLTVNGTLAEDEAEYYCQQGWSTPLTFGGGTTVEIKRRENAKPSVFIFRPSVEQITSGSASSVCFVDQFYPGDAKVTWKADNKVITSGVETSDKIKDKDSTYSLSSTLTMPSAEFKKYETFTCEVTHVTLTPALATSFKASECTF